VILEQLLMHPDKVFWPDEGYTKLDLARFYESVFPKLQPYVQDRMLSLERCPEGMGGPCFYQKKAPKGMPVCTPIKPIVHHNRTVHYVVGGLIETQIALVNLGCIPVHAWASCASHPHQPDWVVFDIDPGSGEFGDAAKAGLLVKEALEALGLLSFPKTSGGRGLHVFLPIQVGPYFDKVLSFAEEFGKRLAAAHPDTLTVEQRLNARGGSCLPRFLFATHSEQPWQRPIPCAAARRLLSQCRFAGRMWNRRLIRLASIWAISRSASRVMTLGATFS
jgi:bifunctional non-homologous end joining protein LigD